MPDARAHAMGRRRVYSLALASAAALLTIAFLHESQWNPATNPVRRTRNKSGKPTLLSFLSDLTGEGDRRTRPRNGKRDVLSMRGAKAHVQHDTGSRSVKSTIRRRPAVLKAGGTRNWLLERKRNSTVTAKNITAKNSAGKSIAVKNIPVNMVNGRPVVRVLPQFKTPSKSHRCFSYASMQSLLKKELGFVRGKMPNADNPKTIHEVQQRAMRRPRGHLPQAAVSSNAPVNSTLVHKCITPVFIRRSSPSTVALLSLPGSGNTWMRYLLEQATGIYTGSIYFDRRLYDAGLVGEDITTSAVSVVKYHTGSTVNFGNDHLCPDGHRVRGVVFLIRNPYDATISEYNRRATGSHVKGLSAEEIARNITVWTAFSREVSRRFVDLISVWSKVNVPFHIVYYEDLKKNTTVELVNVIDFLQLPTSSDLLDCVTAHKQGNFKREHSKGTPDPAHDDARSSLFSSEQINAMDCALMAVDRILPGLYRRYAKSGGTELSCK